MNTARSGRPWRGMLFLVIALCVAAGCESLPFDIKELLGLKKEAPAPQAPVEAPMTPAAPDASEKLAKEAEEKLATTGEIAPPKEPQARPATPPPAEEAEGALASYKEEPEESIPIPRVQVNAPTGEAQQVSCAGIPREGLFVLFVVGQGNAANFGEEPHAPQAKHLYSFYRGSCYHAQDPLPGANGPGGSVWARLGEKLLAQEKAKAVVLAVVARKNAPIVQWTGGQLLSEVEQSVRELEAAGLPPTYVLIHQGEDDAIQDTPAERYRDGLKVLLSKIRSSTTAPVYLAQSTHCYDASEPRIAAVQREMAGSGPGVRPGPNADALGAKYRYDGCYFTTAGLDEYAGRWLKALFP